MCFLLFCDLNDNIIIINQLSDQDLCVKFISIECTVANKQPTQLFDKNQPQSFLISKSKETEWCHRKLRHLNLKSVSKFVTEKAIVVLPNIKIEEGKIYGDCQVGK